MCGFRLACKAKLRHWTTELRSDMKGCSNRFLMRDIHVLDRLLRWVWTQTPILPIQVYLASIRLINARIGYENKPVCIFVPDRLLSATRLRIKSFSTKFRMKLGWNEINSSICLCKELSSRFGCACPHANSFNCLLGLIQSAIDKAIQEYLSKYTTEASIRSQTCVITENSQASIDEHADNSTQHFSCGGEASLWQFQTKYYIDSGEDAWLLGEVSFS